MKKRITFIAAVAVAAVGIGAAVSSSQTTAKTGQTAAVARAVVRAGGTIKLSATLTAANEVPRPKGVPKKATGTFTATLKGSNLTWTLSWAHLSGIATTAHIHQAKPGVAGPVVVALCEGKQCKSPDSGSSLLGKTIVTAIEQGDTYVNVHTKKNPSGEIRGQLKVSK